MFHLESLQEDHHEKEKREKNINHHLNLGLEQFKSN
jgi:hypothetical protein